MKKTPLLIPYITAGFPTKKLFVPIVETLSKNGADYIEIGVPHSDPLADGPIIQYSSKIALDNAVTLKWIVETLCATSQQKEIKPLILFSYLNPMLSYGLERLLQDLPKPLFHGLIIPDLPLEEAEKYLPLFKKYKLNLILLIAPTTSKERIKKIVRYSEGFIYLVSITGTTGIRKRLTPELKQKIKEIKSMTNKSVLVGFGISSPKQAKEVISYGADGVIVGSALTNILKQTNNSHVLPKLKRFIKGFRNIIEVS